MKNKNSNTQKITIEAEMPIPLEEISEWLQKQGEDHGNIFRLLEKNSVKIIDPAKFSIYGFLRDENVDVKIEKIEHLFNDSSNIVHGMAYFKVELSGTENDLKKISGFDKLIIYDWNK